MYILYNVIFGEGKVIFTLHWRTNVNTLVFIYMHKFVYIPMCVYTSMFCL